MRVNPDDVVELINTTLPTVPEDIWLATFHANDVEETMFTFERRDGDWVLTGAE